MFKSISLHVSRSFHNCDNNKVIFRHKGFAFLLISFSVTAGDENYKKVMNTRNFSRFSSN